jgi:hypothetical protein
MLAAASVLVLRAATDWRSVITENIWIRRDLNWLASQLSEVITAWLLTGGLVLVFSIIAWLVPRHLFSFPAPDLHVAIKAIFLAGCFAFLAFLFVLGLGFGVGELIHGESNVSVGLGVARDYALAGVTWAIACSWLQNRVRSVEVK